MINQPTKVVILYRVVQSWRLPVFNRLSDTENIDLTVLYGPDFKGTKVVSSKKKFNFKSQKLISFKLKGFSKNGLFAMPVSPFLFFKLIALNPNVVITECASNLFNALVGYIYCRIFNKKYIWWGLGTIKGRTHSRLRRLLNRLINHLERNADAVISYSSFGKEYFQSVGVSPDKVFVATNVIDTDLKKQEIQALDRAKIYQDAHKDASFVVLFVGALIAPKKVDMLLNAYAKLEANNKNDVKLIIVGDGPERQNLEHLAQKLHLKKIEFTGKVFDGVSQYFLAADIFILPGLGGLAVSEALVHGLPVIASIGDGCEQDLVITGLNGIIDDKLNVNTLAAYLQTLKDNPAKLSRMKQEAIKMIDEKHNINTYMTQILKSIAYVTTT